MRPLRRTALFAAATLVLAGVALVQAPSAGAAPALLSQGRPATASTSEGAAWAAGFAVDGDLTTRWGSTFADPQWLQVDLGGTATLSSVGLRWEAAYASAFQLQSSVDGTNWTTLYSTTTGTGGTQTIPVTGTGRYVRMLGTARATGYGYSLWEFQVFGETGTTTPPPPPPTGTWSTVWTDDFTGTAGTAPAAASWLTRTGTQYPGGAAHWGTGEVETATANPANVSLDGAGHLSLTALKDGAGNWTSGRLETQRTDFAAPAGGQVRFAAVLRQPDPANGLGYWPGFRATGAAYRGDFTNWPGVGETDIMTDVNGRSQSSSTLHCGSAPGGVCNEYDGRTSGLASCTGCQTGYHEYSQIIDRTLTDEEIRFYLDGRQTWVVRESQVGVTAWRAAVQHGFYLRLDLGIGGSLPNAVAGVTTPTAATSSGGTLSVDSVTVQTQTGTAPVAMTDPATPAGPSVVKVTGAQGNWQLTVNGAPWQVRGLTYGPPQAAADGYVRDLHNMGVNTIRTWAVDDANTAGLLDKAAQQGIKVIVGHWLNQGADYVNDTAYKASVKAEVLARVNALKGHQGLLMWDVGNEVLLTMQDHGLSAADVQARRVAYAQFVNELAVAIHAADPNHPVTSTDAWQVSGFASAWSYYKQYSPALDLYAINAYGGTPGTYQTWLNEGLTKPYVITESGPFGEWEVPNDVDGVPTEPADTAKRDGYVASWGTVTAHPGVVLGATEFHYGVENDFGGVWLNTTPSGWRRLSYATIASLYGHPIANTAPVISTMSVSNQTAVPAGGTVTVTSAATDPDGDPLRYNLMFNDKYISGNTGLTHVRFTETAPGSFTVTAPQTLGVWKVYVYAYDGHGNVGIETRSFRVVPPPVAGTNVALGKPATASSFQPTGATGPQPPGLATDGNLGTRWASDWSDPQWIQVDLGAVVPIRHVQLVWEAAAAAAYTLQVSNDGVSWSTAYSTDAGDGGVDDVTLTTSGRYVRMTGTRRTTGFGYSLWEFGIYN
jgi:exo-beta-1,3-glucanase (GH17 family)